MKLILAGFLGFLLMGLMPGCGSDWVAQSRFHVRLEGPRHKGDSIEVSREGGTTVFTVSSEFGIGRARIRPRWGVWPESIAFHFNLKGLEGFMVFGEGQFRSEESRHGANDGYRVALPTGVTGSGNQPIVIEWVDFFRE